MIKAMRPPQVADVRIDDDFWSGYQKTVREKMLPYQYDALADRIPDAPPSGCINNFMVASGRKQGEHYGFYFQDSDLYKWIEAAAYSLALYPDAELQKKVDDTIELVKEAQREDGYLDTYYTVAHKGKEWTCLIKHHELYCAGHLTEAAVAYFEATGKRTLLDVAIKFCDLIYNKFGTEEGKLRGYPGHEELELALIKLARATGDQKYVRLAKYFIDERGKSPNYFAEELKKDPSIVYRYGGGPLDNMRYYQADVPVREQTDAHGHAVRACYLYSGMVDVARETGDAELMDAAKRMFLSIAKKRMYVTGAIGSSAYGEAFTTDYDLPNDTVYGETCASIALAFFAQRLLQTESDPIYADVMERAIFNTALAGMSLEGRNFFYVNPLETDPDTLKFDYFKKHVLPSRPAWYGCACCPPNIARLTTSIAQYAYLESSDTVRMLFFIGGRATMKDAGLTFTVKTDYPFGGSVEIGIENAPDGERTLGLRLPDWCPSYKLALNGEKLDVSNESGFLSIKMEFKAGDSIRYEMDMPVMRVRASAMVREDIGRVAIQRGPLVYCLEEIDNGKRLFELSLPKDAEFTVRNSDMLGGIVVIEAEGERTASSDDEPLYSYDTDRKSNKQKLIFVPYSRWNNRGEGEMSVYVRESL